MSWLSLCWILLILIVVIFLIVYCVSRTQTNQIIGGLVSTMITHFNQLKEKPYSAEKKPKQPGCHVGQRKLVDVEMLFYGETNPKLVVYIGAAPQDHLPINRKLFPKTKFLLIDPNFPGFDTDFVYVYQNSDVVPDVGDKYKTIFGGAKKRTKSKWYNNSRRLLKTPFWKSSRISNVIETRDSPGKEEFEKSYKHLIKDILEGDDYVYFIQDYFTIELSNMLRKSFEYADDPEFVFVSDIRSKDDTEHPEDINVIRDNILQMIGVKMLNPYYSMLKFRTPYFENLGEVSDMDKKLIEYVKDNYGYDPLKEYHAGKTMYFNGEIILQPWAPKSSTEARLVLSRKQSNDPFINYDHKVWENKFYYLNFFRRAVSFTADDRFRIKENWKQNNVPYDDCFDCNFELAIILRYLTRSGPPDFTTRAFEQAFKTSPNAGLLRKIYGVKHLINKHMTHSVNKKCEDHGRRG